MRSSLQTELERVTRKNTKLETEKGEMEHNLIAGGMKLKVKEEELDQSKKEADMYKNSTVKLAKEKFKLEEELIESRKGKSELEVGMGKEMDKLKAQLKNLEKVNRDLEKKHFLFKVCLLVCYNGYACIFSI